MLLSSVFVCVHVCTLVLEMTGSAAIEPRQDGAVFLLPVVEVFTVPIHMCVIRSENTLYLMAVHRHADIFVLVCGWLLCGCQRQTDRAERREVAK